MGMQVANTILSQLGGNRFLAMTGARDLLGSEDSLTMRLPRGAKSGITHIRVTLDPSDTYTMTAMKFNKRTLQMTTITAWSEVYADNIRGRFEDMTGLYTRL